MTTPVSFACVLALCTRAGHVRKCLLNGLVVRGIIRRHWNHARLTGLVSDLLDDFLEQVFRKLLAKNLIVYFEESEDAIIVRILFLSKAYCLFLFSSLQTLF